MDDLNSISEELDKFNTQRSEAHIVKDGPSATPYCVYSKTTNRKFGCYATMKEAQDRLAQIELYSK